MARAQRAAGRGARAAEPGAAVARRGARQHDPRVLRRAAARASGRGARRSAVLGADRVAGRAAVRPGVRRVDPGAAPGSARRRAARAAAIDLAGLRRRSRARTRRSIACAAPRGTWPQWRDFTAPWTRRAFDRDGDVDRLVERAARVRRADRRPVVRARTRCFSTPPPARHLSAEIAMQRSFRLGGSSGGRRPRRRPTTTGGKRGWWICRAIATSRRSATAVGPATSRACRASA